MVALSITQEVKERKMKEEYGVDKEGYLVVTSGWRSWGCVTAVSSYMLTLVIMVWYAILGAIAALPFVVLAVAIGVSVAILLGYIGR